MQLTEVDGIPTLLAPTSGPTRAGLTFRVGRADETLATVGITHLVEHLALSGHALGDYHYNGATGTVVTHFHAQGSDEVIAGFLSAVCDALTDLPFERLETEKSIMRAEASSRSSAAADRLPLWRYGARDYGLVSYDEFGLSRLTADDLREWVATWFTRENAVLWIAGGQVPAGLVLKLPSGVLRPVPVPSTALPVTPAYFIGGNAGVAFDAVVRHSIAANLYAGVLERELFRHLRQAGGYSYSPQASCEPRGDGCAVLTAAADAVPNKQDAVLGSVVDVLAKLTHRGIDQADLDAVRTKALHWVSQLEADSARLPAAAMNVLTGQPNRSAEETVERLHAVRPEELHAVALEARDTMLIMAGQSVDWAGFSAAPPTSPSAVEGRRFGPSGSAGPTVVVGPAGISAVEGTAMATVRFDECSAVLAWPDGARHVFGHDAISVRLEPTLIKQGAEAVAAFDAAIAPDLVVPMERRPPENIPQPVKVRTKWYLTGAARDLLSQLCFVLAAVGGMFSLIGTSAGITGDPAQNPDDPSFSDPGFIALVLLFWLFTALTGYFAVRLRLPPPD